LPPGGDVRRNAAIFGLQQRLVDLDEALDER
jgi:hypothetical protein